MKINQFLDHHGIARNPFAEEDAQSDPVFKDYCINDTYHPSWDKIFGDPTEPATSVVFGEKGAGKTAMRLQIVRHVNDFNHNHPGEQLFAIEYDDFNPFIDRFLDRLPHRRRRIDRALVTWRLWDHMDAVLSLGVTDLVNRILGGHQVKETIQKVSGLDRHQRRDLLLLAACYDQSTDEPFIARWNRLRRKLNFWTLKAKIPCLTGWFVTLCTVAVAASVFWFDKIAPPAETSSQVEQVEQVGKTIPWWAYLIVIAVGWTPWLWKAASRFLTSYGIVRGMRVITRPTNSLRKVLMHFTSGEIVSQPLPNRERSDDRYELLSKFQSVLNSLGFSGVFVLVDRVDEPHAITGSAELMKALIWPLLDNKFLKHPGVGVKLMLPAELKYFVEREDREFVQRARLDKQNMVPSLAWTGEALYDVANARLRACAADGNQPNISEFFDDSVSHDRLLDGFRSLRVPRHLHKFLYRLLVAHCNAYTDEKPQWKIPKDRFESELALYGREMGDH